LIQTAFFIGGLIYLSHLVEFIKDSMDEFHHAIHSMGKYYEGKKK
jgi:hypothetical protein